MYYQMLGYTDNNNKRIPNLVGTKVYAKNLDQGQRCLPSEVTEGNQSGFTYGEPKMFM